MTDLKELENAAFWLPTHFLTDDIFTEENHLTNTNDPNHNQKYYDLFNSGFGSDPFDSSDNDDNNTTTNQNDDVLLLSHLTRHFSHTSLHTNKSTTSEKQLLYSTSPQSTLSGFGSGNNNRSGYLSNGSPSGPSTPPLTPELKNDAAWDLLYEAAGEVARLRINAIAAQMNNNSRDLLGAPRYSSGFAPSHHRHNHHHHHQELKWAQKNNIRSHETERSCGCGYHAPRRDSGFAWTPLTSQSHHHNHNHQYQHRMYRGGSSTAVVGSTMEGVKRRSTGTGVFLPRRISTSPPPPRRNYQLATKPTVALPEANLNFQPRSNGSKFPTDHEIMWARRNVILGQQRKTETKTTSMVGQGQELSLPNDWTY